MGDLMAGARGKHAARFPYADLHDSLRLSLLGFLAVRVDIDEPDENDYMALFHQVRNVASASGFLTP